MASTNKTARVRAKTYEGGTATIPNPKEQLERAVMSCLLWEDGFYESGEEIADRIAKLCKEVKKEELEPIARRAKFDMKIRHAPLWVARHMAKRGALTAQLLADLITRADDLTEFLSLYWMDKKQPLSAQVKKGLALAFHKFDEYQLAKYDRAEKIKLRDVLFLSHAKPVNDYEDKLWKRLISGTLATPDTWEVALSGGKDKKETWERLIAEGKLGALALLRNLRNMQDVKVPKDTVRAAIKTARVGKILPWQFIAAAKAAPDFEPELEEKLAIVAMGLKKLPGKTVLIVDVSGSMEASVSEKSAMTKMDQACGLAMVAREMCEDVSVFTFSDHLKKVPPRKGFALRDAIVGSQGHSGTYLGQALIDLVEKFGVAECDRIIIVTDEQAHDSVMLQTVAKKKYILNVGEYNRGVGYGQFVHISGFSEKVLEYLRVSEGGDVDVDTDD